ncbi:MAG TPA: MoxR family ATPase, partial [Thermomicrobiales bacterium]|nr:MoxR family ATPase [Thermomicrobiales bacterium]
MVVQSPISPMPPTAFQDTARQITDEVGKVIVGQRHLAEEILIAFFAGGHVLLEGVPGLGKTRMVHAFAQALDLEFSRIQFTPDLMPADITGTSILKETPGGGRSFAFQRGPLFANIVLADEINRATPKTQSALLEAMQEGTVSVLTDVHQLPRPFTVLATQNPLEMEGTYPLPEAQLDRFFFKSLLSFPDSEDLQEILSRTVGAKDARAERVIDRETVAEMQQTVRSVVAANFILDYASRLTLATHPDNERAPQSVRESVRYGASPRGAQALILAAKIYALLDGRYHVSKADIEKAALPALRH